MNMLYKSGYMMFIAILFSSVCISASAQELTTKPEKITFMFAGDIMGHDEQIWSAENRETRTFNYDDVFRYISPVISKADIAIANLEVTLAGKPYKGYPQFSSPADLAVACRNAGFDCLVTANNHAADRGKQGIISTINKLDSIGMPHTGTFLNRISRDTLSPLMIHRNGVSAAVLSYTFSTNGIKVPEPVVVNMLDKEIITNDIKKAKNKEPDIVVLFLHWGTEYDTVPSKNQSDLAATLLSAGADLVIGSHPHVLQKMVWLKDQLSGKDGIVVYSLGNFVSNQRKPKTDGGSIVSIEFIRDNESYKISNAGYYLTWVYTPIENYRKKFFILPCSEFESNFAFFKTPADWLQMKKFQNESRKLLNEQNLGIKEYIYHGGTWLLNN
ncbi:MAG: CapA family protein [Bacteroidales bacterium]|nr:CapA family protein [Bacteroidales bacterium]